MFRAEVTHTGVAQGHPSALRQWKRLHRAEGLVRGPEAQMGCMRGGQGKQGIPGHSSAQVKSWPAWATALGPAAKRHSGPEWGGSRPAAF